MLPKPIFSFRFMFNGMLLCLALLSILYLWPGYLSPDSNTAYVTARAGNYQECLGPLFQFLWRCLDSLKEGPGLMLAVQMSFFWGAVYLFSQNFLKSRWAFWFPCVFLYPSIFVSIGFIWKDLYFTFGYMLVAGYLTKKTYEKTSFSLKEYIFLIGVLFFATSIKYQAQFVLVFMLGWMIFLTFPKKSFLKVCLQSVLLTAVMLVSIDLFHEKVMLEEMTESHSWQKVKIFDLAGISVKSGQNVVPSFLFKRPHVSLEDIDAKYSHSCLWEPLVTEADSPLRFTKDEEERAHLKTAWRSAVLDHPLSYLQHRSRVFFKTLTGSDVKRPLRMFLHQRNLPTWPANISVIFSYIFGLPLSIFYIILSLRTHRRTAAAVPLFILNSMAVFYALALFIFSLASTSRYVYFCVVCLAFSHPFAYACWRHRKHITSQRGS